MITQKMFFLSIFLFFQPLCALPLAEQFKHVGYVELCNKEHGSATFDLLYVRFDEFITFLQANPAWANKLYNAKERFIRSKGKSYYSTDFFGFYDESERVGRSQISFITQPIFMNLFVYATQNLIRFLKLLVFLRSVVKFKSRMQRYLTTWQRRWGRKRFFLEATYPFFLK